MEVTSFEKRAGGEAEVYAQDGRSIVFSRFHVDPGRFEHEVLRRAGLNGPLDADSMPSLRS